MINLERKQINFLFSLISVLLLFSLVNFAVHERVVQQDKDLRTQTIKYVQEKCTDEEVINQYIGEIDAGINWEEVMKGE